MRILSPIDRVEEVEQLAEAGAHELYGGVIPDGWRFLNISPNQRTFAEAQFPSEGAFAEAVAEARSRGLSFHLTLNAPLYPPERFGELLQLVERSALWGVESWIVGDLGLLRLISRLFRSGSDFQEYLPINDKYSMQPSDDVENSEPERRVRSGLGSADALDSELNRRVRPRSKPADTPNSELKITLSTMAGPMNHRAAEFYKREFGVKRIVLPRHLTLGEMGEIVSGTPGVDFEAFVLIGKCPNEEAYCTFQHISPDKRWPCEIPYRMYSDKSDETLDARHPLARREALWRESDRRFGCGLCALDRLQKIGVEIVKLVGRGGPTAGKVENVRLVKRFLETGGNAKGAYRERFGRPCTPLVCYFPEIFKN